MSISIFDLFTIGIGPSSSHTVGPMRAARRFVLGLRALGRLAQTRRLTAELFGSLGQTGLGHGSDGAVLLGLEGETPEKVDSDRMPQRLAQIRAERRLRLLDGPMLAFDPAHDLVFRRDAALPRHPNGLRFTAYDDAGAALLARDYYSIGGGFVIDEVDDESIGTRPAPPYSLRSAADLLVIARMQGRSISDIVLENEKTWCSAAAIRTGLLAIWQAMQACVARGLRQAGVLPGGLRLERRAPALYRRLLASGNGHDPLAAMDWINAYALAVSEENAAGGRVVTAPTNGAAGIVPAVLHYHQRFHAGTEEDALRFLLTAGAIGILYKENASISGAEVGCQGEVGVACSMAAGALTEALGGSIAQVENAAEIGMEHNLGLTCDPVGGLVQIPCIERNAMGAVKAVNAARMALAGDGRHHVSLDEVIAAMRQTGADMQTKYKETSRGGLAVNVIEC